MKIEDLLEIIGLSHKGFGLKIEQFEISLVLTSNLTGQSLNRLYAESLNSKVGATKVLSFLRRLAQRKLH